MEEQLPEKPKKSIWDIIDTYLPSATAAYGKIRQQKTGVNPFDTIDTGLEDTNTDEKDVNYDVPPYLPKDTKNRKTLYYVLGGVALIGLGIGTYYFIQKNKKS